MSEEIKGSAIAVQPQTAPLPEEFNQEEDEEERMDLLSQVVPGEEQYPEEEEPKKKVLTLNQRKWLETYMQYGNATAAAIIAYYPEQAGLVKDEGEIEYSKLDSEQIKVYNAASTIGSENLRKLEIPLDQLLDEAGLTDVYLTLKLKENLNATKLYGKDSVSGMDGNARNDALKIALKIKGKLIDKVDHTTLGKSIAPKIVSKITPYARANAKTTVGS